MAPKPIHAPHQGVLALIVLALIVIFLVAGQAVRTLLRNPGSDAPREANRYQRLLSELDTAPHPETDDYDRAAWGPDTGNDCWSTRTRVLLAESRRPVERVDGCRVVSGLWVGPWGGRTMRTTNRINIDHHVPILIAHLSGGSEWDAERKRDFANDPLNLHAVDETINRKKSANGPDKWRPPLRAAWCAYAQDWIVVKHKYALSVTRAERRALTRMLRTCGHPPYVAPVTAAG